MSNFRDTTPEPIDFRSRPAIKPGVAATRFYLVVAESDGDVAAYEIAPPQIERKGPIAVENQGEGEERIWHASVRRSRGSHAGRRRVERARPGRSPTERACAKYRIVTRT